MQVRKTTTFTTVGSHGPDGSPVVRQTWKVGKRTTHAKTLRIRGTKLHISCTCPYFTPTGEPCKHIWATVLLADARNLIQAPPARPLKLVSDLPRRSAVQRLVPESPASQRD